MYWLGAVGSSYILAWPAKRTSGWISNSIPWTQRRDSSLATARKVVGPLNKRLQRQGTICLSPAFIGTIGLGEYVLACSLAKACRCWGALSHLNGQSISVSSASGCKQKARAHGTGTLGPQMRGFRGVFSLSFWYSFYSCLVTLLMEHCCLRFSNSNRKA